VSLDEIKGKVTPEVVQSVLLDELLGRMITIQELLENQVPVYHLVSTIVSVTDVPTEVNLGTWVDCTMYNDGADNVYIYNQWNLPGTDDSYLASGENLKIDNNQRTNKRFYLVCASGGTATVRIFHQ